MTGATGGGAEEGAETLRRQPGSPEALGRLIETTWTTAAEQRAARDAQAEAARDAVLASDAERDAVTGRLADAFAHGRLTRPEFEERTSRALAARTHGELDDVLHGLGGLTRPMPSHPARKAVFWVLAVLTSPFVLLGSLLTAFGQDAGDRVFGVVFLVLFLPGLWAMRRWAWPRH
jgi:hypothetical protein